MVPFWLVLRTYSSFHSTFMRPLPRTFYQRSPDVVAPELLGKLLYVDGPEEPICGRIVEVEAYLSEADSACHAARGQTRRNGSMFGPPGHAYVYAIHSRWCLNVVTQPEGTPSAVLIRAVEPVSGIEVMQARRGREKLLELARGPGRLCEALGLGKAWDGWDLTTGQELWIAKSRRRQEKFDVHISPRIGVTSAFELPLRYCVRGNPYVSGTRRLRGLET